MSVDTLNKHVLQMLSHLNKYPIPDPQMVRDFNWFIKQYNLSVKSGDVTPPIGGNNTGGGNGEYSSQDVNGYLNNVIFSELSFAPTFTTLTTNNIATTLTTPGVPFSDMYSSMPDVIFNNNRVIGLTIELIDSLHQDGNDTFQIVDSDSGLTVDTFSIDSIIGNANVYTFGYVDSQTVDNVYSVDESFNIVSNISFYYGLELAVDNINSIGEYTFQITYHLV